MNDKDMLDLGRVIQQAHAGLEFGTVTMVMRKHEGVVSSIDVQSVYTNKVANNTEALAVIMQLMKAMQAARQTGNVTFTIAFYKGDANKVMVQDLKHNTAREW